MFKKGIEKVRNQNLFLKCKPPPHRSKIKWEKPVLIHQPKHIEKGKPTFCRSITKGAHGLKTKGEIKEVDTSNQYIKKIIVL